MDERELVLTSLIYPLIFREAAQIGIATPIAAHIRELLKIHTPEPEVIRVGNATPVSASVRNIFQNYEHPLQDYAQIGVAKPVGAYFKNLFNEYIHPHSDFTQIGNAIPVSMYSKNMLQNLQTFKTDHVVQISNAIPEAVYSTCKPVVFAPVNLRGWYDDESIRLFWSNNSITHSHQNLYRSTTPFTESNLPPVYQYIFRGVNSYIDEDVVEGVTYYYAVSTEAGLVQLVSDVTEVVSVEVPDACDPHWDKVVSLLHFDGDTVDLAGREWVVTGSPAFTTDPAKFGQSIYLPDRNTRLQTVANPLVSLESFTIETFFCIPSGHGNPTADHAIAGQTNSGGEKGQTFWARRDGTIGFKRRTNVGSPVTLYGVTTVLNDVLYHAALTYDYPTGKLRLFLDGNLEAQTDNAVGWIPENMFTIGAYINTSYTTFGLYGYLDEFRITKGEARYTENFTPPTKPFPNFGCS